MNVGKNHTAFIKHSLQEGVIDKAEFELFTARSATLITHKVHSMRTNNGLPGADFRKGQAKNVIKILAAYITAHIKNKLDMPRMTKSFQRFLKRQDRFRRKLRRDIFNDIILGNKHIVTERKRALNIELLDRQRLVRGGVDPTTKNAKTWRKNKVNRQLEYEFGFDTTILYKSQSTLWRNANKIIEQLLNRKEPPVYEKDPFGHKEKEERQKRLSKIKHDKYSKYKKDPMGEYLAYQIDKFVKIRPDQIKKPKPILEGVGTLKQDYKVDIREHYDEDEELIEQYIRIFKGDLIKARNEFLRDYQGNIPTKLQKIWEFRINNDNNIVKSKFRQFGNDVAKAGKSLLELCNGNPSKKIQDLFFFFSGGQNLEDYQ